jgi:hypothetical protein
MTDLFIVEQQSYYPDGKNYLAETNVADATKEATVNDLLNAQFDDRAVRVYILRDVTDEFRKALQERINRSEDGITPDWLIKFMTE